MTFEQGFTVAWCMAAGGIVCWFGYQFGRFTKEMWPKREGKRKRTRLPTRPY